MNISSVCRLGVSQFTHFWGSYWLSFGSSLVSPDDLQPFWKHYQAHLKLILAVSAPSPSTGKLHDDDDEELMRNALNGGTASFQGSSWLVATVVLEPTLASKLREKLGRAVYQ